MDNKTSILNNALELFASKGYEGTGVQEICDASKITKPTLYHYFGNKKGLLDEIFDVYFGIMDEKIFNASEYHGDLTLTLQKIAGTYFDIAREHTLFYRMKFALAFGPPESEATRAVSSRLLPQYHAVEKMFELATVQNGNMRGRQKIYAVTFIGAIDTYISLYFHGIVGLEKKLVYGLVHQFMHGILS